jgi:hypothetical protein
MMTMPSGERRTVTTPAAAVSVSRSPGCQPSVLVTARSPTRPEESIRPNPYSTSGGAAGITGATVRPPDLRKRRGVSVHGRRGTRPSRVGGIKTHAYRGSAVTGSRCGRAVPAQRSRTETGCNFLYTDLNPHEPGPVGRLLWPRHEHSWTAPFATLSAGVSDGLVVPPEI